jgi:hypothetical protein
VDSWAFLKNPIWQRVLPKVTGMGSYIPVESSHSCCPTGMFPGMTKKEWNRNGTQEWIIIDGSDLYIEI